MRYEVLDNNIAISENVQEYFTSDFRESAHYRHFIGFFAFIKNKKLHIIWQEGYFYYGIHMTSAGACIAFCTAEAKKPRFFISH